MMLFYTPAVKLHATRSASREMGTGISLGIGAGYLGGLLGVGGGNFILPALIWIGFDSKKAAATTAFIVIFSSLSGFFGHSAIGNVNWTLLLCSAVGSLAGAAVGSWLMHWKLDARQVKSIIGIVLYAFALKMFWGAF
jgi:hypothetical protein